MEKQEMAQMMERLLANINANHEEMIAWHKKMMTRMDGWLTDTNDNREETKALQEKTEVYL
jgi:hypothetical protein